MHEISKYFSFLIAAGQNRQIQELSSTLRRVLFTKDENGNLKSDIFKWGQEDYPELFRLVSEEVEENLLPIFKDVPVKFWGYDNKKIENNKTSIQIRDEGIYCSYTNPDFTKSSLVIWTLLLDEKTSPINKKVKSKYLLSGKNEQHIMIFRRVLESSQNLGFWWAQGIGVS